MGTAAPARATGTAGSSAKIDDEPALDVAGTLHDRLSDWAGFLFTGEQVERLAWALPEYTLAEVIGSLTGSIRTAYELEETPDP
ncbi:hypothetical protein [Nocardia miyunensis]|uniref:hypothetical protein n=1 Tax=Nocardia miyunensis TaxID=282684 RepID=UPI000831A22D|nr:hypothetical protein [Nocardia miyunensis]